MTGPDDQQEFDAAHALWRGGDNAGAARHLTGLTARYPGNPGLFSALGVCQFEMGDYGPARFALERALELDPEQGVAAFNLAHLLLMQGEEERGFALYERRWASFVRPSWHPAPEQAWRGEKLDGTLLVLGEQGLGDMIQFARFLPAAAQRCRRLVLAVPPELKRLAEALPGLAQVVTAGEALPAFDRFAMLLSLPHLLKLYGPSRPVPPYLAARKPLVLADTGRLRVGLVWAGRAAHAQDRLRSLTPERLAPLLDVPGVDFFSLQWGQTPPWPGMPDLAAGIADLQDTADRIAGLDLLISADSAPAHLAGAMGKPVFAFVTFVPDWRWGLGQEVSSWYPSIRLFRQPGPGDWEGAVALARKALSERVDSSSGSG
jgi:hypothetical protein